MILINGQEVKFETFPNGETLLKHTELPQLSGWLAQWVSFKYESDADLIKLMLLKNYLDSIGSTPGALVIYYMPYSRMDRSENRSPFTLKYVANFINSLGFRSVEIIEPHSDVTSALVNNSVARYINYDLIDMVKDAVEFNDELDYIVFPDAGAQKRYSKMRDVNNPLVGFKNRSFETGQINSLKLVGNVHPFKVGDKSKAIIVDDLSSYGGTFIQTSKDLRGLGIDEVYLLVAHAENNIFKTNERTQEQLFDHIDHLFTTDSLLTDHVANPFTAKFLPKLTVYKVEDLL